MADELLQAARQGDPDALNDLIDQALPRLFGVALRLVGQREDAEDCVQEAAIRIVRSLSSFKGQSAFLTWASRITMNCCYDFLRRQKKHQTLSLVLRGEDGEQTVDLPDPGPLPDQVAEQREQQERVRRAALQLREPFRSTLIEIDLLGLSYEEVARRDRLPLGTIKSRLSRARRQAGRLLADQLGTAAEQTASKEGKGGGSA